MLLAFTTVLAHRPAYACNYVPPKEHTVDPSEIGLDLESPGQLVLSRVVVNRDPTRNGLSCWDGIAWIEVEEPTDNRTPPDAIGVLFEVVDGDPPDLYSNFYPGPIVLHRGASTKLGVSLPWSEPEPVGDDWSPIRFTVRIIPLDAAGNRGPPTDVVIADPPIDDGAGGCSTAHDSDRAGVATLLFPLLIGLLLARGLATGGAWLQHRRWRQSMAGGRIAP